MSRPNISYPTPIPSTSSYPESSFTPSDREYASAPQRGPSGSRAPAAPSSSSQSRAVSALDTSITRLLVTTKQLLQGLELWASGQMSETEISDIYVRLGDGFEICVKQFRQAGLSTSDLDSIPDDLRECLEEALSCDPSQDTMQQYLPTIRDIVSYFLNGLKVKQAAYRRAVQSHRASPPLPAPPAGARPMPPPPVPTARAPSPLPQALPQPPRPEMNDLRNSSVRSASSGSVAQGGMTASGSATQISPTAQIGAMGPGVQGTRIPSSQALAERQRAERAARPAPPDAFRPPRTRLPEGPAGVSGRGTPSPSTQTAILPQVQLPPDGIVRHQLSDAPVPFTPPGPPQATSTPNGPSGLQPPNVPPPKPIPHPDRFSRDSFGNPRPVSRFSADSDITNGSPIRSPTSKSPPMTLSSLPEMPESQSSSSFAPTPTRPPAPPESSTDPALPTLHFTSPSADLSAASDRPALTSSQSGPALMPAAPITDLSSPASRQLAALANAPLERRASKRFSSYTFNKMLPGSPGGHKKSGLSGGSPQRPARRGERAPPMPALEEMSVLTGAAAAAGGGGSRRPSFLGSDEGGSSGRQRSDTASSSGRHANGMAGSDRERLDVHPRPGSPGSTGTGTEHSYKDAQMSDGEGQDEDGADSGSGSVRVMRTPDPNAELDAQPTPRPAGPGTSAGATAAAEADPTPAGPIAVYLQIGRQVRKATLEVPTTMGDLKLLFMERFEYDPGLKDFPDVYVRDNRTGVQYELEEMDDVREGCVLSLDIEPLDQVKQHFDTTFASMMTELREMKMSLEQAKRQSAATAASHLAPSPSAPPSKTLKSPVLPQAPLPSGSPDKPSALEMSRTISPGRATRLRAQQDEIATLRRDLAVMRQTHVDFLAETKQSFTRLREQNASMRQVVNTKLGGSRALLDTSKTKLDTLGPDVLSAVNDVSDLIDQAREDVYRRSVTPAKNQMAKIGKDLAAAKEAVERFSREVATAEPIWRATWHQELARVMDEQKALPYHHKFREDLEKDIKDAGEMWANVTEYVSQRQAQGGVGRGNSRHFRPATPEEDGAGAMPNLLMEIRTKEGDPESRLKAIEAQRRAREREIAERTDEFSEELAGFVAGKKLKKTGGTDEAERAWQRRHEKTLKRMLSETVVPPSYPTTVKAGAPTQPPAQAQAQGAAVVAGSALSPQMTGASAKSAQSASGPE